MKHIIGASALAIAVLLICLGIAVCISQPREHVQYHNAYYPFTVELVVKDR